MVGFRKAFDVADNAILFKKNKLSNLPLPDVAINWFMPFFTERKQYLRIDGHLSSLDK